MSFKARWLGYGRFELGHERDIPYRALDKGEAEIRIPEINCIAWGPIRYFQVAEDLGENARNSEVRCEEVLDYALEVHLRWVAWRWILHKARA